MVLFADEAFYAGDKKHESILKYLITEQVLMVEKKYRDPMPSQNCVHLIMASNAAWVVPAGQHERRYFVLDVGSKQRQKADYFKAIQNQMDNGGREALLHHLLSLDLDGFNVEKFPRTEALQAQQGLSMEPLEEWWYQKLDDGQLLQKHVDWEGSVVSSELLDDCHEYLQKWRHYGKVSPTSLGMFLAKIIPGGPKRTKRYCQVEVWNGSRKEIVTRNAWHYQLPSLEACRENWKKRYPEAVWTDPDGSGPDPNADHY